MKKEIKPTWIRLSKLSEDTGYPVKLLQLFCRSGIFKYARKIEGHWHVHVKDLAILEAIDRR